LESELGALCGRRGNVRLISTVTGQSVAGEALDAGYWRGNLRDPVLFERPVGALIAAGYTTFVEIGAHPLLSPAIGQCAAAANIDVETLASLRREMPDEQRHMLESLARLYCAGFTPRWNALHRPRKPAPIPQYPFQRQKFWIENPSGRTESPKLLRDGESTQTPEPVLEAIVEQWAGDGAHAITRSSLAPDVFLGSDRKSFFYCFSRPTSLTGLFFVGPPDCYRPLVQEIRLFAERAGAHVNLIADEGQAAILRHYGFPTTICGVIQTLPDLRHFSLAGPARRRLRYMVQRYRTRGEPWTLEYARENPGALGPAAARVMDEWLTLKRESVPFASDLKRDLIRGTLDPKYRVFVTGRGERAESALVLSPVPRKNGYLLDLEFYGRETPLGSTEFAVTQVIQQLVSEGYTYLSLGGTFGTELEDGEGGDLEVTKLLREMALANKLNGDANFQYKRKFGGETGRMYLCRTARGADTTLTDVLEMLASTSRSGAARRNRDDEGKSVPAEEIVVQLNSGGYLKDHRLDGRTIFPGAGYISLALGSL